MDQIDLFELAEQNRTSVKGRFDSLVATSEHQDQLIAFARHVDEFGRIGINMKPMTLIGFMLLGALKNVYEWADERASESTRSADEMLRDKLGAFYDKRVAFDSSFMDGKVFRYGALNTGSCGASYYGEYCAIFSDLSKRGSRVAYLRADSLKTYLTPELKIDRSSLKEDVSPPSHRQYLATIKHASATATSSADQWAVILSSKEEFLEVIFVGQAGVEDLQTVRLPRAQYEEYFELGFETFRAGLDDVSNDAVACRFFR